MAIMYKMSFKTFSRYCKHKDPAPREPFTDTCKIKSDNSTGYFSSYDCERKTCPIVHRFKQIK